MALLQDENLLDRILEDFDACGIVGERIGKLTGYLAATSRLLPKPLGVVIQSSSAAGKTSLLDAILAFMPPEHQFGCSAMTSQESVLCRQPRSAAQDSLGRRRRRRP